MNKNVAQEPGGGKKRHVVSLVFFVVWLIFLLVGVALLVVAFTPAAEFIFPSSEFKDIFDNLILYFKSALGVPDLFSSFEYGSFIFFCCYYLFTIILLFFFYLPFVLIGRIKSSERKVRPLRYTFLILSAILVLAFLLFYDFAIVMNVLSSQGIILFTNPLNQLANLFASSGVLASLAIPYGTEYFSVFIYLLAIVLIVSWLIDLLAMIKKRKKEVKVVEEQSKPNEEVIKEVEVKEVEQLSKAILPTYREVKILDSLEGLKDKGPFTLPLLEESDVEKIIESLDPNNLPKIRFLPEENVLADEIYISLGSEYEKPDYLPGLDDLNDHPFIDVVREKEDITQLGKEEVSKPIIIEEREPLQLVTIIAINAPLITGLRPQEEIHPYVLKETLSDRKDYLEIIAINDLNTRVDYSKVVYTIPKETYVVAINSSLNDGLRPQEEEHEKEVKELASDRSEYVELIAVNDLSERKDYTKETYTAPKETHVVAINSSLNDGLRPQEEEHEKEVKELASDRSEYVELIAVNDLSERKDYTKETYTAAIETEEVISPSDQKTKEEPREVKSSTIDIPEVKEEEKVTTQDKEEVTSEVREAHKPLEPLIKEKKEPIRPDKFVLSEPIKKEEKEAEKAEISEKESQAPKKISGPLHPIRARNKDIKAIDPQKVSFDVKKHKIRVYQGNLTAQEAFEKAVTKVQSSVNPIFLNSKQDTLTNNRQQALKEGYYSVNTGKLIKPTKPISAPTDKKQAKSIRELLKSKRNDKE